MIASSCVVDSWAICSSPVNFRSHIFLLLCYRNKLEILSFLKMCNSNSTLLVRFSFIFEKTDTLRLRGKCNQWHRILSISGWLVVRKLLIWSMWLVHSRYFTHSHCTACTKWSLHGGMSTRTIPTGGVGVLPWSELLHKESWTGKTRPSFSLI